ncbi:MAG: glycosyltransferase family 9 protein [Planctomycetes bacterium]|nr:glycosyltransferase family 9 protein [Planctomycetota bacterium]MCB9904331.1 glycosyltransferase family 9 protein [Planctomycetota bacterium]
MERITLVKLGAIGDAVNSLPLVNRLRDGFPEARIQWVIGPLAHGLISGHAAVDDFLVLDSKRAGAWPAAVRELRASKPELVIDLQRILKSGVLTRLSGAPRRLGFDRARCKESSWLFTNERIAPNPTPGVTVEQYLEFADHLGLPPSEPRFDLPHAPWSETRDDARPLVVLNLGASKEANRWYADAWAALADALVRELDAHVVLSGGKEDRATADEVARLAHVSLDDRVGALTLKQSAGLFDVADLFVGCDTGPLHMSVAVGTPVVALFGAADPRRTGPFAAPDSVVTHRTDCQPCRKRRCFVEGHPCMRLLTAEVVMQRVRERLAPVVR